MRKCFSFALVSAALAAMTIVSCTKEFFEEPLPEDGGETREVVFDLDSDLTKTAISQNGDKLSINWINTSNSSVHIFENGKEGTNEKIIVSKTGSAAISVNFSGLGLSLFGGFNYNGIIAGNFSDGIITVPAVQNPADNSFDPSADVLIAKTYYAGKARPILTGLKLNFVRANAISRLQVTGMKAGEKIEYVDITASNPIAGPFKKLDNTDFSGYDSENGSNNIKLYFPDAVVGEDGSFVTYFSSWRTESEVLTVNVKTKDKEYILNTEPMTLTSDEIKTINLDMSEVDVQTKRYELVTSAPEDWSGTYIFVSTDNAGDAKVFNAKGSSAGYCADIQVKKAGEMVYINASNEIDKFSFDISKSGSELEGATLWNIMSGSYSYLFDKEGTITVSYTNYSGSYSNRAYYRHTLAFDKGAQVACVHNGAKTYLEYTDAGFAYTTKDDARVYLYKYKDSGRKSQVISFKDETVYWTLAEGKYEIGQTYPVQSFTRTSSYQKDLLSYSSSNPSVASIDAEGNITIHKQGEVTIEAVAANSPEYRSAGASYQIIISVPYYQRIHSESEIVSGDKYLIVSRSGLIASPWYHAFNATAAESGYDYDITNLENVLIGNPVYDNGERIRPSEAINANQVIIEDGLLSTIAKLFKLNGNYTIKPVATGNYLYCDMSTTQILDTQIQIPTFSIAFDDVNLSGNLLSLFSKIATIPHSIIFNEDGTVSVRSALSSMSAIGANLIYNPLTRQYGYVNMSILDGFDTLTDFMQYYSKDTEYEWIVNLIKFLGDNISIKELIEYFAADMYIYRYIG